MLWIVGSDPFWGLYTNSFPNPAFNVPQISASKHYEFNENIVHLAGLVLCGLRQNDHQMCQVN